VELVIFDCDGVLVDSERIAVQVDIEVLAELGWAITADEVVERFVGRSDEDMTRAIEEHLGISLPASWDAQFAPRYHEAMAALTVVDGVTAVLDHVEASGVVTCVASNGSHAKIERSLRLTGLHGRFGDRIFSVDDVTRAKPEPDLFLHAASTLDVAPASCAVVEDSRYGVAAARAAGMQVFGYGGGVTPAAWLEGPGTTVFHHMHELPDLLGAALT
jgi:HAD superfamily hydrolase (TIGR01509 family)